MIQKNNPVIPIVDSSKFSKNQRPKSALKGRQADEVSLKEVRLLIPESQYRRDLLIENLKKISTFFHLI
jgi:formate dehydrogenase